MIYANEGMFVWDERKAASSLAKHGISFEEAVGVFLDPMLMDVDATQARDEEVRRKAIGVLEGRILTVVHTLRPGATRIISARTSNAKEKRAYDSVRSRS